MASKGPRSRLDHESRAKRQKALEAPKEPPRPKAHWDHVLEEMVWLSKDFEAERKWKMSLAKRVALRATKSLSDQATRGEKKLKEEEQRLRKVALNISKDVKKFWTKIEKLVLYKYQLEAEERKKRAMDKQLNFLLGQTERYSTMLAENLVSNQPSSSNKEEQKAEYDMEIANNLSLELENSDSDGEYENQSNDEMEDDERTIEEDEAKITEAERREELAALEAEANLPLEEILKAYSKKTTRSSRESSQSFSSDNDEPPSKKHKTVNDHRSKRENGIVHSVEMKPLKDVYLDTQKPSEVNTVSDNHCKFDSPKYDDGEINGDSCIDQQDDTDYEVSDEDGKDDEATLSEEEELAKKENVDTSHEINLLQKESEIPIEELLARYRKDGYADAASPESDYHSASASSPPNDCINPEIDGVNSFQEEKQLNHSTPEERELKEGVEGVNENENTIEDAAAAARLAQPTGNTFSTTKVRTKFPFLLKFPLREYQHIGLDWLVTMYEKRLNGILADEMGLGKTIMTISLLAHLACEKGIWGPHLIVVPTSVMLNWETEFLKWCPAFKILTYFGSAKERKQKRQGWMKPNYFHVCITTYRLVIQDSKIFKRKKWKYLILDEAHLIKNWKSQRWQTLLNFNSKRRILLTGTPLQNDLMELWSLMHFLMPHVFQSHQEFKDWFCNPISGMVEGQEKVNKEVIDRLHNVLRPFILRRLKRDVEKQLPKKHEHVIYCRLSRRQRNLYEDFIASSETQATLASANFFGMISVIMQLRKVCNHPDLFEGRPIISSFDMAGIEVNIGSDVCTALSVGPFSRVDLEGLNLVFTQNEFNMTSWESDLVNLIASSPSYITFDQKIERRQQATGIFEEIQRKIWEERERELKEREEAVAWWNRLHCRKKLVYGTNLREIVAVKHPVSDIFEKKSNPLCYLDYPSNLSNIVLSPIERFEKMVDVVEAFTFAIPASRAPTPVFWCTKGRSPVLFEPSYTEECSHALSPLLSPLRPAIVRRQVYFPDRRLVQFDCGKLQELSVLLRRLRSEGHRALIFTQMTKMLDVLEEFINLYGYTYLRLDGSTPPEERQTLMQRFNTNPKFFLFILSTRSGGVGINLVGADTVIFYDSDWNPAMDQQAQDRCHRIGQTREVHIYRLISESTIEENILKKANQKRALDDLVIQSGSYNTEFFKKLDPMELFSGHAIKNSCTKPTANANNSNLNLSSDDLSNADVEAALKHAEDEADYMALKKVEQEEDLDNQEFTEETIIRSELLDEDDVANDEDPKLEERNEAREMVNEDDSGTALPTSSVAAGDKLNDENALNLVGDEEVDMLADVKQMAAAAAAAGQESWSFENQLRPIDRYAMRFLDLWDPIVDRSHVEETAQALEEEWELERIERMKDEMEAEIDEDQEPLLYERWDAEFATEAYRQHVEALTQQKLLEEMEYEAQLAREREELEKNLNNTREGAVSENKTKSKKKGKKAKKFKSLKKGKLASKTEIYCSDTTPEPDGYNDDYNTTSPETISSESPPHPPPIKKRKLPLSSFDEENQTSKKPKKVLKCNSTPSSTVSLPPRKLTLSETKEGKKVDTGKKESNVKSVVKAKRSCGFGLTISYTPVKQVMMVKPEKLKKVGNSWSSKDFVPDVWSCGEDAVLCATLHEYGPHWGLVSDMVHTEFGFGGYRGRSRHPVHCCERFRELFFKHVMSTAERDNNTERASSSGSGKAILKVTEDQIRLLLNITSNLPDNELLLQRHFMAVLSSVWRLKCRLQPPVRETLVTNLVPNPFSSPSHDSATRVISEIQNPQSQKRDYNLVRMALASANNSGRQVEDITLSNNNSNNNVSTNYSRNSERMDLVLAFVNSGDEEVELGFPTAVSVSVHGNDVEPPSQDGMGAVASTSGLLAQSSCSVTENRFRMASRACFEGEGPLWATSSAFPPFDATRYKSGTKHYLWGKNKSPFTDLVRPSKSKSHKNSSDNNDALSHYMLAKSLIPSPEQAFRDSLDVEYNSPFTDFMSDDTECTMGVAPHEYDPNFTAGLEELESISDFTDIG
ncbi:Helicase SWR1 [Rhynchospora pubera]|uniref:DNA helicase n=1 Tax=Rhynchospora pubera TaxID=906938 RepID=A0AAV8G5X9_9POAL|nr:Helicase SWR1 [Rhynchospora pubera]